MVNVRQAIRITVKKHGIEILNTPQKFQAMVVDYVKDSDQDIKIFVKCCRKDVLSLAREIVSARDKSHIETIARKMKEILEKENFMAGEYAIDGTNIILQGLDVDFVLKRECVDENDSQDIIMRVNSFKKENIYSRNET